MRLDFGSFHGNGNAVEEDDHQDDMIKHLVRDDFIAHQTESAKEEGKKKKTTHRLAVNARLVGDEHAPACAAAEARPGNRAPCLHSR